MTNRIPNAFCWPLKFLIFSTSMGFTPIRSAAITKLKTTPVKIKRKKIVQIQRGRKIK